MYKITVDGVKQYYIARHDAFPETVEDGDKKWDILMLNEHVMYMKNKLSDADDFRPIILHSIVSDGVGLYFRLWLGTPPDLEELDQKLAKVSEDEDVSQYFRDTIFTYYALIWCRYGCQSWWHTLTFSYPDTRSKVTYDTVRPFLLTCPKCGERFSTHVVKIFEEAEPPEWAIKLEEE